MTSEDRIRELERTLDKVRHLAFKKWPKDRASYPLDTNPGARHADAAVSDCEAELSVALRDVSPSHSELFSAAVAEVLKNGISFRGAEQIEALIVHYAAILGIERRILLNELASTKLRVRELTVTLEQRFPTLDSVG